MKTYGEYKIVGQKIGSGAFGEIFTAFNKRNEKFAIKVEKTTSKNPQLYYESKILQILDSDGRSNERGILKVDNRLVRCTSISQRARKV
jgi:predicted Ser/Thr protein kinase